MRWVTWVDPLGKGSEPCFHAAKAEDIIRYVKELNPELSDEHALEEFMVVHWATIIENNNDDNPFVYS